MGAFIGLWIEGMAFLGAYPEEEGGAPVSPSLGAGGFLLAGLSLLFGTLWLVIASRLPEAADAAAGAAAMSGALLVPTIVVIFGIILTVAGIAQMNGWDLRPVGQMCVAGAIALFLLIIAFGQAGLMAGATLGVGIALIIYLLLLVAFIFLIRGKLGAKPVGYWLLLSALAALWLSVGFTGVVGFM